MKKSVLGLLLFVLTALAACTDDTAEIGYDLMPQKDEITSIDSVFNVESRTALSDSLLSNTSSCYLGSVIDPDTRIRTSAGFLAQFHLPDNCKFPSKDGQLVLNDNGEVEADSCNLYIWLDSFYGDSLTTMKLRVRELSKDNLLHDDGTKYYTTIDASKYIAADGIVDQTVLYAVKDLTRPDNETNGKKYYRSVKIALPKEYGTRIMRSYFDNKTNFENNYLFIKNVCPGLSVEHAGGSGVMLKSAMIAMDVAFRYHATNSAGADTILSGTQRFGATEEVLQTNKVTNEMNGSSLKDYVEQLNTGKGTYIQSPAGLYTELVIPVDSIVNGRNGEHYTDSLSLAQLIIRCKGTKNYDYSLPTPQQLLLVRKDSLASFFENGKLPDSETSFLSTAASSSKNYYAFSNISTLVTYLKNVRDIACFGDSIKKLNPTLEERRAKYAEWEAQHPEWNKLALVAVDATYTTSTSVYGSSSSVLRSLKPQLGLTSVQLEGGEGNPLQLQVIYSRYKK